MKKDQVMFIRDAYLKEAKRPNGTKSTMGEYVKFALDGGIDFVTAKDLVVYDDGNELLHCICVNDNLQSQADFPVKIISSQYEVIQQIESVMSTENMENFLDDGFLSNVTSNAQKEFIKKWMKTIKNQAIQPMDPEPMWKDETKIIAKGASKLEKDPFMPVVVKCKINGESKVFSSFDDAIANRSATGKTSIKLFDNEKMVKPIQLASDGAELDIDLNGYTLEVNDTLAFQICNGSLNIRNGSIIANNPVLELVDNGSPSLTLDNVNVESKNSYCILAYGNGTLRIYNSKLSASGEYATISGNGSAGFDGTYILIRNSKVYNTNDAGIYLPQNANLDIIDSTISGLNGIYQKSGKITIDGDDTYISGTGECKDYEYKSGGYNLTGDAVTVDSCEYPGGEPSIIIRSGRLVSKNSNAIACYDKDGKLPYNASSLVCIYNAQLNTKPNDEFISTASYYTGTNSSYFVKTKSAIASVNGTSYANIVDAINNANDGDTVNFVSKLDIETPIEINKSVTLNVKDINASSNAFVASGENVNVVINANNSVIKAGMVPGDANTVEANNGATVTINGGKFGVCPDADGLGNSCVYSNGGNIIINDGYFSSDAMYNNRYYVLNKKNGSSGTIIVNGGNFKNYNPETGDDVDKGSFLGEHTKVVKTVSGSDVIYSVVTKNSASVDGKAYKTIEEAFKNAKDESIVSIEDNVNIKNSITIDKNIFINIQKGVTVTAENSTSVFDISSDVVIYSDSDSKIVGASGMDANAITVRGNGSVRIVGGNYSVGADASGLGNSTIYAVDNATVTIDGGHFETAAAYNNFWYVLNKQNKTNAKFDVISGEFLNYNPENGDDADGGNFVNKDSEVSVIDLDNGNKLYKVSKNK